jgi:hypothetical protein
LAVFDPCFFKLCEKSGFTHVTLSVLFIIYSQLILRELFYTLSDFSNILLDETEPEQWVKYTAYDFFTEEEKRQFNPDGSFRPEYVEYACSIGISEEALEEIERRKKIDVQNYNEVSARYAEQGINFGEQQMQARIADSKSYLQRREQMKKDLRNFEDVDSLPFDKGTPY